MQCIFCGALPSSRVPCLSRGTLLSCPPGPAPMYPHTVAAAMRLSLALLCLALAASVAGGAAPTRAELAARAAAPTMPPVTAAAMSANYDALCAALDPLLQHAGGMDKLRRADFGELLSSEGAAVETEMCAQPNLTVPQSSWQRLCCAAQLTRSAARVAVCTQRRRSV